MTSRAGVMWMMAGWDNGGEEASEQAAPESDNLLCGPGMVLVPPAGAALRHEEQAR
jgi:hypothetical protein